MAKLIIQDLNKIYSNGVHALNNINLTIDNGMFGLLGPNGAGKSSLMRTLATLQTPDSGSITLNGLDILKNQDQLRQILGYLPQEFGVYPRITAEELLDHLAILKGITQKKERKDLVDFLLNKVNLYEHKNKAVKGFSGGMKQRVGIAQALIGDPKIIIVDEPTAGLDPGERNRFHNLLADVGDSAVVILSTHIVDDVRELCTDMAIMSHGEIVYNGSPENVISELEGLVWQKTIARNELEEYNSNYKIISNKMVGGKTVIHILSNLDPSNGFVQVEPDLEDVFFTKTSLTPQTQEL
ncbi:ATP-binding cassette domain-containing protein [Flammeovirga yaeyamensis]|uniref:ATP-binding cassette domain-containing protein n=1 Tax=Flammeovirga yaeyamensis TaxID=367791 RepID=A0AAX1N063_9BACT|nr:ABC transporter ATP-binding protein [Flammeovirga yaeyamensis]MBB3700173.1 ABC-type multidrug transport system ATPase subunit [Flammeovirga yaeyamensis]NMF37197.1 ABC transporter ATP-binding protein [Flammeovirga yaeyamensis]QWG00886.1 ATP-binding cassette domain-containing protein [Flammeovirga yaeyamensis]